MYRESLILFSWSYFNIQNGDVCWILEYIDDSDVSSGNVFCPGMLLMHETHICCISASSTSFITNSSNFNRRRRFRHCGRDLMPGKRLQKEEKVLIFDLFHVFLKCPSFFFSVTITGSVLFSDMLLFRGSPEWSIVPTEDRWNTARSRSTRHWKCTWGFIYWIFSVVVTEWSILRLGWFTY
jgi:hypothetical protein